MKYLIKEMKTYSVLGALGLFYKIYYEEDKEVVAAFRYEKDAEKYLKEKNNE